VSETLASILRAEPDWTALPDATPVSVRTVLKRALTKERKARMPDISVARYLLEDRAEPVHTQLSARPPAPVWRRALPLAIAAVLSAGITLAAVRAIRPVATPAPITRFQIALGEGQTWSSLSRPVVALSPDGTRLVYVADNRLFIRSMNDLKERAIVGSPTSAGTLNLLNPVFSPDGEWIAYWERNQVKKVNAAGGAPVVLGTTGPPFGMTWSGDELLLSLVEGSMRGIFRLPENGGKPELLIGMKNEEAAYGPQRLPDGKTILFTRSQGFGPDRWDRAHVLVQAPGSQAKVLFTGTAARYLPTGHIVFAVGGVLNAVRFDARRLEVLGSPVPVVEGVRRSQSVAAAAHFTVSNSGTLAYLPGSASSSALVSHLALIDRNGTVEVLKIPPGPYEIPRMSPDGTRIAFGSIEGGDAAVWVSDVSGATAPRRLTFGGRSRFPVWSADSQRVAFQSDREGDEGIFWQRADGSGQAERLTRPEKGASHVPESWSPKDERLAFIETRETTSTLWTLSVKDRTVTRFDAVESLTPTGAVFSPDGRWLVYSTRETAGQTSNIMYVQPFPPTGVKYQISPSGDDGHHAVWSRDGKELLFVPGPGRFVSMPVSIDSTFSVGSSVPVPRPFQTAGPLYTRTFDMTPTGKILGLLESSSDAAPAGTQSQIHVVLNWTEELKSRVPSR
jgi:serine/threonine-protein kinase